MCVFFHIAMHSPFNLYLIGWSEQNSTPPAMHREAWPVASKPMQEATA